MEAQMNSVLKKYRPILRLLTDAGFEAYFVGGCVRDSLLSREIKDVDITTSASPEEVARLFCDTKLVGAHFGVSLVKMGDLEAEVATFRTDGCYSDSRRPDSVAFTSDVVEDLERRDFTINALLMDKYGVVHDKLGTGLEDLHNRIIRCVGDPIERFREDALRTLRCIRFAAQLGFKIHHETFAAIHATYPLVSFLSAERIAQEMVKMLCSGRAAQAIYDLESTGILTFVMPEVSDLWFCNQNPNYHPEGNVFIHTCKLLDQLQAGCSVTLALAALLHDVGKPATLGWKDGQPTFHGHEEASARITKEILQRLKFPTEVIDTVVSLVAQHMTFRVVKEMRKAKLLRFARQPNFRELLELHYMDAKAGSGNMEHYDFCLRALSETPEEVLRPIRLITGHDLLAIGLKGKAIGRVLQEIETAQLEGTVKNKEEALELAQDLREQDAA